MAKETSLILIHGETIYIFIDLYFYESPLSMQAVKQSYSKYFGGTARYWGYLVCLFVFFSLCLAILIIYIYIYIYTPVLI